MAEKSLIRADPAIMMGKPVVAGTRITVELILDKLAAGESIEQILSDYPQLSPEALRAVFRYLAEMLRNEVIYPIASAAS